MPQQKLEYKQFAFSEIECKDDSSNERGTFKGVASTFGNTDLGGDIMVRGCFRESMKAWAEKQELPACLYQHDMREPVGDYLAMKEGRSGLDVEGKLWIDGDLPPLQKSVQAYRMLTGTGPKGLSIGFIPKDVEPQRNGTRKIKNVDLLEVSIVSFPMNPKARITQAKSFFSEEDGSLLSKRDAEDLLRECFNLTQSQAKIFLAKGWDALTRDVEDGQGHREDGDSEMKSVLDALNNLQGNMKG